VAEGVDTSQRNSCDQNYSEIEEVNFQTCKSRPFVVKVASASEYYIVCVPNLYRDGKGREFDQPYVSTRIEPSVSRDCRYIGVIGNLSQMLNSRHPDRIVTGIAEPEITEDKKTGRHDF